MIRFLIIFCELFFVYFVDYSMRYLVLILFSFLISFSQEETDLFTDSITMQILNLEKTVLQESTRNFELNIDFYTFRKKRKKTTLFALDTVQLRQMEAYNATLYNLNWANEINQELNNNDFRGVSVLGIIPAIFSLFGLEL